MASLHKDPKGRSPFWFCAYRLADGRRTLRSTKCEMRKQALEVCRAWERAAQEGRSGRLSVDAARDVIARGVRDAMLVAGGEGLPSYTVRSWCERWLESKQVSTDNATFIRYKREIDRFLEMVGAKAEKNLEMLRADELAGLRDRIGKSLSRATANMFVKIVRTCLGDAQKQSIIMSSPAAALSKLKMLGESKRRPFTLVEIKRLLEAAGDSEWNGMILAGLYTGARLGDIARLRWNMVDLQKKTLAFVTEKTGRRMVLPLARPFADFLTELPSSDNENAFVFPQAAQSARKQVGTLSNGFHTLLVRAGLATEREKNNGAMERPSGKLSKGAGRRMKRNMSEVSFHSLRHSFVSMLKATGATDAIARELAGHESAAINRHYTHLGAEDMRGAVDALPDITKETQAAKKS